MIDRVLILMILAVIVYINMDNIQYDSHFRKEEEKQRQNYYRPIVIRQAPTQTHIVDERRLHSQLEPPVRRYQDGIIPGTGIHSQGGPENYQQVGVLIRSDGVNDDNYILKLFGRREYQGARTYEYYFTVNSGNDFIKFPLEIRGNRELYDDDEVYIELYKLNYKVQLYEYDTYKYNPNIFYI